MLASQILRKEWIARTKKKRTKESGYFCSAKGQDSLLYNCVTVLLQRTQQTPPS